MKKIKKIIFLFTLVLFKFFNQIFINNIMYEK